MYKEEYIKKHGQEAYDKILERNRLNYQKRKEVWRATRSQYYANNKDYFDNHNSEYYKSLYGRARNLLHSYQVNDRKYNRGETTIDADFIVNNIFSKNCVYCGESNYLKLGCDRIINEKPHTPDNVICCCKSCNLKRQKQDFVPYFLSRYVDSILF